MNDKLLELLERLVVAQEYLAENTKMNRQRGLEKAVREAYKEKEAREQPIEIAKPNKITFFRFDTSKLPKMLNDD